MDSIKKEPKTSARNEQRDAIKAMMELLNVGSGDNKVEQATTQTQQDIKLNPNEVNILGLS